MSALFPAIVEARVQETQRIVSLRLAPVETTRFPPFTAGAHVNLHLDNGLVRSYSILSPAEDTTHIRLGILHAPDGGGGSHYVHTRVHAGMRLMLSGPRNNFPLATQAPGVFIAGGIGITPLLSMARHLAGMGQPVVLHYCARSRADAAFLQELTGLAITLQCHFDDEQLCLPDLPAMLRGYPAATHFYCCGPPALLESFQNQSVTLGIDNTHIERFNAAPTASGCEGSACLIVLARSGQQFLHDGRSSLLDALLARGINVPHGCRQGLCGSCETGVLDGTPDHRDSVLDKQARQAGKVMMVCVSGCRDARMVLDL